MSPISRIVLRRSLCALLVASGLVNAAHADDEAGTRISLVPKYKVECGVCHAAFPPGMLPAASWSRVMSNLPRHYGTDASLDSAAVKELSAWLGANAGTYKRVREEPPADRITRSGWFIRKHDEVPPAAWTRPAVKSAANCSACHSHAEQGDFNEHYVRIPR
ncbi:MAG: diheme cytochrome c [Caldimonas sp.]